MTKPVSLDTLLTGMGSFDTVEQMARRLRAVAKKAAERPHDADGDSGTCFRCSIERALNGESE